MGPQWAHLVKAPPDVAEPLLDRSSLVKKTRNTPLEVFKEVLYVGEGGASFDLVAKVNDVSSHALTVLSLLDSIFHGSLEELSLA